MAAAAAVKERDKESKGATGKGQLKSTDAPTPGELIVEFANRPLLVSDLPQWFLELCSRPPTAKLKTEADVSAAWFCVKRSSRASCTRAYQRRWRSGVGTTPPSNGK